MSGDDDEKRKRDDPGLILAYLLHGAGIVKGSKANQNRLEMEEKDERRTGHSSLVVPTGKANLPP